MAKTLKFVSTIILVIFLFFITNLEEVASTGNEVATILWLKLPYTVNPTTVKCKSPNDCPEITLKPNTIIALCVGGFCQDANLS
ncbi:unnamed protein product [Trifolium pratense]|uniref:Uncharacterized protein n=1 Tax=Trifolium pratense TaxID=57577 RepID=A0ACB0LAD1_TRIPR|nr:unnamed protein product [Trifolium pratense]